MAIDLFTTGMLNRIVRQIDVDPAAWLLTTFFPVSQAEESEEIHFDVEDEQPRLTPWVPPEKAGRIVENEGFQTNTFKPAYAKDKRVFQNDAPVKRALGEPPIGNLSGAQRTLRLLAQAVANQNRMLTRREEVMASEILRTGSTVITGEGFDPITVNFGRAAALTVTPLTGADKWDTTTADPVGDMETWAGLIYDNGGGIATDIVLSPDVWQAVRTHAQFQNLLDTRRGSASRVEQGPLDARRVRNPGFIGDFTIWIYQDAYIDETGAAGLMMPSGEIILCNGAGLQGVRHYGMIKDYDVGHGAQRVFSKSWREPDPSVQLLLLQSAPLVVPYRPNSSLGTEVLNG